MENNWYSPYVEPQPQPPVKKKRKDMKITIKNSTFVGCQAGDQGLYVYETDNTVPTVENNTVI